ncbi:MAG: class I SAM-dependent methyltransferase [Eubacteriales bacterium]|nr:class I SAM-dependent methyltransferase [Eubacteriales bacterium]
MNTLSVIHDFIRRHVQPGACCIDATAGRGRDTALLCRLAGPTGRVLAFDIQREALEQTRALLAAEGLHAALLHASHADLAQYTAPGSVDCIVFNLGRLPGGDPHLFTTTASTLPAIDAGLELLRPGGVMAIALYYGKENGYAEKDAVLAHLATIDSRRFTVLSCTWLNRGGDPPLPILIWKDAP